MGTTPLRLEPGSPSWPGVLDHIASPPSDLWLRGRVELLSRGPRIGIVGTRAPTPYGVAQAERFARGLASLGLVVVSGLARGIDQAAHRGALAIGGDTIAVLASGVDVPWPTGQLTDEIARDGLLLSDYPPGQAARRHHFPLRNRLISGLSEAVLVVEAAWTSGSLITARWAVDQGRAVFAVPGRVDHPMARGTLRLLREGATPVESPEQLVHDLLGVCLEPDAGNPTARARVSEEGRRILGALEGETLTSEEVATRLGLPIANVLGELVELELVGLVVRGVGGLFRLGLA